MPGPGWSRGGGHDGSEAEATSRVHFHVTTSGARRRSYATRQPSKAGAHSNQTKAGAV
jgi:hypothetical protein